MSYNLSVSNKVSVISHRKSRYAPLHFRRFHCLHDMLVGCSGRPSLQEKQHAHLRMSKLPYNVLKNLKTDQLPGSRKEHRPKEHLAYGRGNRRKYICSLRALDI